MFYFQIAVKYINLKNNKQQWENLLMNDEIYRGSSGDKRGGKCCNSHEKSPKWRRADKLS